jgi:uncharacterized protein
MSARPLDLVRPTAASASVLALVATLALGGAGCSACSGATAPASRRTAAGPTPELREKLAAALRAKGPGYVPRTRHKNPDGSPKHTNRLILETSPYLLQHAHNPVDWYPWGEEAFATAKALGRPVFLSVGYSTCHWCHVMEEESFEDEEIAAYLNDHYVAIKVDREERPDVDAVYMTAVQMLTGSGGWPMSVWLTPAREPFFGGTYFPPRDGVRGARRGFLSVLTELSTRFAASPSGVVADAKRLAGQVRRHLTSSPAGEPPGARALARAVEIATRRYDPTWGGARGAPKFPSSFPIRLLLRHHRRTGDAASQTMARETLRHMAAGGIHDHVGGGFHRYATDARWAVPHFEKMLYDNALLAVAYVEGWQSTGDPELAQVARETLDDVLRDMTSPGGGFYSATDADSPAPSGRREEGWFFTWTPAEIEAAVGAARAPVVERYFAVTARGNLDGRTILSTPRGRDEVARDLGVTRADLDATLGASIPLLRQARSKRPPPLRDEKVQTSWNGLMISALARAALALHEPRYERAAVRAAELVLGELSVGGELRHSALAGKPGTSAFLDDHAFFAAGLLDLFELTSDPRWLRETIRVMAALEQRYADRANGGYFLTAATEGQPLARSKPDSDGAVPSGNSVALMTELRLATMTTDDRFRVLGETTLRAFSTAIDERPSAFDEMMLAVDFLTDAPKEIAIVLPSADRDAAEPLMGVIRSAFVPNRALVVASEADLAGETGKLVPWAAGKPTKGGKPTAYVCRRGACELPTSDPKVLAGLLASAPAR